jgi:hypothetical protein
MASGASMMYNNAYTMEHRHPGGAFVSNLFGQSLFLRQPERQAEEAF